MIKDLVNKNCSRTKLTISGVNGYYTTIFKKSHKIYVLDVSKCNNTDTKIVKFRFDKNTNKLECWDKSCKYGSLNFIINWVESDYSKKLNV